MMQLSRWKVTIVVLATIFGLLFTLPNLLPQKTLDSLPGWVPAKRLNLGLDLQGGSYLMLEVDTNALVRERLTNVTEDVRTALRGENITFSGLGLSGASVKVQITDPAQADRARTVVAKALHGPALGAPETFQIARNGQALSISFRDDALKAESGRAVDQSIEIIRRRIDELGTREPSITRQGSDRIVVQAPGESDPERLKRVIGQTAKLTFQMVDDTVSAAEAASGRIPPGSVLLPSDEEQFVLVKKRVLVSGDMLTNAQKGYDQYGKASVDFRFDSQGAKRFASATTQNVGKRFAIVLDGKVISAPTIINPITGGSGQITGSYDVSSANDLAILLRAGALPAPLTVEEQRTVGAELGADAVQAGQTATLVAFAGVLVFMVLAYGFLFGGISVVALIVNGLLIIAAMSFTQATLSLPGIAGLILTLAMAVDANVLIYERMRDEVRAGHNALMAMNAGFQRAWVTIVDANLTTLIAAWIMFIFGAGPVRGFAWTLSIGVITSVFTAVLITQVLLAMWYRARRPKTLPIV
jgi:preprotein translocase subunit SecD